MGTNASNFGVNLSEDNAQLFQASYAAPTGYGDYVDQKIYEHVFNTDSLFPDLNEYEKLKIVQGFDQSELALSREAIATLKIVQTGGIFKNVVGHYNVDADGSIRDVSIAFNNTRAAEAGLTHSFNINGSGEAVNFFMIANGHALNREFSDSNEDDDGVFSFVYNQGEVDERPAQITDNADDITLIYQAGDGQISSIRGPVYHATSADGKADINSDGDMHVVSGLSPDEDNDALRVGFEDFPGLGDADYNDVVFDVNVSYLNPQGPVSAENTNSLSNIEPAGGDEISDMDVDINSQIPDINGAGPMSGTGLDLGSYNPSGEFAEFLVSQVEKILPDLHALVKNSLYEEFGKRMYENYEELFAQNILDNFEHIYDEIKINFEGLNYTSLTSENNEGFIDFADVVVACGDGMPLPDQADEAIANFIELNGNSDITEAAFVDKSEEPVVLLVEANKVEDIDFGENSGIII